MELERDMLVSPAGEVPVLEGDLVTAIRTLAGRGVGKWCIASSQSCGRPGVDGWVFVRIDRATPQA
jgi:hypothetical protein